MRSDRLPPDRLPLDRLHAEESLPAQAVSWLTAHGVGPGDRVAVVAGNSRATLALTWGSLRAGIVPVMINTALTSAQTWAHIAAADVRLVMADAANLPRLQASAGSADPATRCTEPRLLEEASLTGVPPATGLAAVPRARPMHFTSGTSGRSKGVWTGVWGPGDATAWAADEATANPTGASDVHLVCSTLCHSGPHRYALNTLNQGGTVLLQPRFEAEATWAAIQDMGVTTAFMVPTHLARLLDTEASATVDVSGLRWVHHAGAACPEPLKRRALDVLPGLLHEFYGATEGQFSSISPDEWLAHPGSVGRARDGRRLRITDDRGQEVDPGVVGRVWVSAPSFARFSYWRDPAGTAAAWDGDFFTVGDLGSLDAEGWLTLAGRRTDLIISGGVNVYPAEVERVLLAHPGVLEGVVFGVDHPEWGQQVTAAVTRRRGADLDGDEVRRFLRDRLAGFQTPKQVHVLDDLPRTPSGKVLRRELGRLLGDRPG